MHHDSVGHFLLPHPAFISTVPLFDTPYLAQTSPTLPSSPFFSFYHVLSSSALCLFLTLLTLLQLSQSCFPPFFLFLQSSGFHSLSTLLTLLELRQPCFLPHFSLFTMPCLHRHCTSFQHSLPGSNLASPAFPPFFLFLQSSGFHHLFRHSLPCSNFANPASFPPCCSCCCCCCC